MTDATPEEIAAIVVMRFDEAGEISYHVCGAAVRMFIVDERCPHDRVYEWLPRCSAAEMRGIIPEGAEIGSSQDARHRAVEASVLAYMDGSPRLRIVETEQEPKP